MERSIIQKRVVLSYSATRSTRKGKIAEKKGGECDKRQGAADNGIQLTFG